MVRLLFYFGCEPPMEEVSKQTASEVQSITCSDQFASCTSGHQQIASGADCSLTIHPVGHQVGSTLKSNRIKCSPIGSGQSFIPSIIAMAECDRHHSIDPMWLPKSAEFLLVWEWQWSELSLPTEDPYKKIHDVITHIFLRNAVTPGATESSRRA